MSWIYIQRFFPHGALCCCCGSFCGSIYVWRHTPACIQAVLKCSVTFVSIPVADKKFVKKRAAVKKAATRRWGVKRRVQRGGNRTCLKKGKEPQKLKHTHWPVLSPADMFAALIGAGALCLLQADGFCWSDFWSKASKEDWCPKPILTMTEERRRKTFGLMVHGDEGEGKRQKNVLVLSWSSIGTTGRSELTKFPFAAA